MYLPAIYNWFNCLTPKRVVLILVFLGLLTYANAINHPFVHDDVIFIQENPHLKDLNFRNLFQQTAISDDHPAVINQYYRPLLEVTNRILYRIVALNPHGFHLFNVLVHITNSFLVYNVIRIITDNKKGFSFVAAILFLIHPVQSEAVACISGISNLLFALLCLASFYCYLLAGNRGGGKNYWLLYGGALLLFCLALLAKEQSVVLPVLIGLYELSFSKNISEFVHKKTGRVIGFFGVLAGYFILRRIFLGSTLAVVMASHHEFWLILRSIPRSLLMYAGLMFFPRDLHYYRSQDILLPFIGPTILLLVGVAVLGMIFFRMPERERRWMAFGLGWTMIALLPTLNIIPMINEYSTILTAEHFLYFPIVGTLMVVLALAHWGLEKWGGERNFFFIFLTLIGVFVVFTGMTIRQNSYWRGEIPLFERTLKFEKDFGRVRFLLAKAYSSAGRFEDAVNQDYKAITIMQGYLDKVNNEEVKGFYINFLKDIHYHLGYCLDMLGDSKGALGHFKKAVFFDGHNEIFRYTLGIAYLKIGDFPDAIIHFKKAIELNANNLMAMNSLALCYQEIGQVDEAEKLLRGIVAKDRQSTSAKQNLENFLQNKKQR